MTNSETYLKVGHFRASKSRQVPQDYVLDIWGEQTMAIHMIFYESLIGNLNGYFLHKIVSTRAKKWNYVYKSNQSFGHEN